MVSVVIPVYNVEKYLAECVDSVLRQTYTDLEVILVDDGSPDSCGAICDEYALRDSRVTVIHKPNGGLSDARNAGMAAAHGEYIYFLDSDDYISDDAIELMYGRAEKEKADLVYFEGESFFDGDDTPDYHDEFNRAHTYPTDRGACVLERLCFDTAYFSCVPFLFIKRRLLIDAGLSFCPGIVHEDELFTPLVYVAAERAAHVNQKLYFRRIRSGSIVTDNISVKSFKGSYTVIKKLQAELPRHPAGSVERRSLMMAMCTKANNILITYACFDKAQRKETEAMFEECLRLFKKDKYFGSFRLMMSAEHFKLCSFYVTKLRPVLKK